MNELKIPTNQGGESDSKQDVINKKRINLR